MKFFSFAQDADPPSTQIWGPACHQRRGFEAFVEFLGERWNDGKGKRKMRLDGYQAYLAIAKRFHHRPGNNLHTRPLIECSFESSNIVSSVQHRTHTPNSS